VTVAFATVLHDPEALLAEPLRAAAPALAATFAGMAVSLTEATHLDVARVMTETLGARVTRHPTGEQYIGLGRRTAVALALELGTDHVLYADPDHMLHWLRDDPAELRRVLESQPETAFLIVGRTERAFAAVTQRLQQTERPINHVYALATGREADLLFAVRRMSRAVAGEIARHATVDTLANDVEWPLLAEQLGHSVGCIAADGLKYRTIEQFGASADSLDGDPLQWLRRIEFAADLARVMRQNLARDPPGR
jgi:hypothetical protein